VKEVKLLITLDVKEVKLLIKKGKYGKKHFKKEIWKNIIKKQKKWGRVSCA
jgi:hypothetical protein